VFYKGVKHSTLLKGNMEGVGEYLDMKERVED
jgi:hypothetical protein